MAFNDKEKEIIQWGLQNGKTKEEVSSAISNFRAGVTPAKAAPAEQKEPGFLERAGSDINQAGDKISDAVAGQGEFQGQGSISRGTQAAAEAANTVVKVGYEALPQPARKALNVVGEKIGQGFKAVTDKVAETPLLKDLAELEAGGFVDKNAPGSFMGIPVPSLAQTEDSLNTSSAAGQIAGNILLTNSVAGAPGKIASATKKAAMGIEKQLAPVVKNLTSKSSGVVSKAKGAIGTPDSIMQRVARISKGKQAKFQKVSGESVGEYLNKRSIRGNIDQISTKLYERFIKSRNTADEAFGKLPGEYSPSPVRTALKELVERETRVSAPGAQSPNLGRAQTLLKKIESKGLTMSEINEAKRLFEKNVKVDYLKSASANPEGVVRATNIDSAIRNWQLQQAETLGLKNLKVINNETRFAKQLLDDIGAEYAGSAGNNAMTLTDWIVLSGGDPTAIGGFITKKIFSSKGIQSKIAEWMNKGKPVMGNVKADIGPSRVPQLPAGSGGATVQVNQPIKLLGPSTMEKGVPRNATPQSQLSPKTVQSGTLPNSAINVPKPQPNTPMDYIQRISDTTKNGLADVPEMAKQFPLPKIIDSIKGDITSNAAKIGIKPSALKAINALDSSKFNSIDAFREAAQKIVNPAKKASSVIGNKKGGYISFGGKKFSAVPEATKKELITAIDYLRSGKSIPKIEDTVSRLAQKYKISQDLSSAAIANRFQDLIEKTKTSNAVVKKVIKK